MTAPNACAYVVIGLVIIGGCGALVWAARGWYRTADGGRCDWCDGFTLDRRKCNCKVACTFVPQCEAREVRRG